ncbi:MAG: outer membrane beta-barrel protein [Bacteroidetes bacterium]|nr:outer membrane beta-barrel protein [Bacteroidota bacterium]
MIPLLFATVLVVSPAQAQMGFSAGYGFNILNQPSFEGATNEFDGNGGFNVGLFYNFPMGRVALQPGLSLRQSSLDWQLDEVNFSPLQGQIRVVEIPVDVRYRFPGEAFTPYVAAGPGFNFVHTAQHDMRLALDRPQGTTYFTSVNLGAGVEVPLEGLGMMLLPELRYSQALSGFLRESYMIRTVPFEADSSVRMSSLTLRLGIRFLTIR